MLLLCLVDITLVTYCSVSNMNDIIMESIEETISNEYVDNLIADAINTKHKNTSRLFRHM